MGLFSSPVGNFIGIDIGSNGIKIVELKKTATGLSLANYGFSENRRTDDISWQKDPKYLARIIKDICKNSKISSIRAISALPAFSVFTSVINLPDIPKKDFDSAVHWEAKKVIPLPLDEMSIDWRELEKDKGEKGNKILLIGAPKTLVEKQMEVFKAAKMNLSFLETETFSLVRSLIGNDKAPIVLVEIGANTTDVSIIEKGIPVFSRSIDIGGESITKAIQNNLNIGLERAEQFKYDLGITSQGGENDVVPKIIKNSVTFIVDEIRYAVDLFQKDEKKLEKIILSGGGAMLYGLTSFLSKELNMNVVIGDPWSRISCPEDIQPLLKEIGPRMAVAIGLAMRGYD